MNCANREWICLCMRTRINAHHTVFDYVWEYQFFGVTPDSKYPSNKLLDGYLMIYIISRLDNRNNSLFSTLDYVLCKQFFTLLHRVNIFFFCVQLENEEIMLYEYFNVGTLKS